MFVFCNVHTNICSSVFTHTNPKNLKNSNTLQQTNNNKTNKQTNKKQTNKQKKKQKKKERIFRRLTPRISTYVKNVTILITQTYRNKKSKCSNDPYSPYLHNLKVILFI